MTVNKGDLISRSALKEVITANHYLLSAKNNSTDYGMFTTGIIQAIDNAPTVDVISSEEGYEMYGKGYLQGYERGKNERTQGECRTCRHRDPEDKKCDCGEQERQGCKFPVSDDYFCKFYEKGGADMRGENE